MKIKSGNFMAYMIIIQAMIFSFRLTNEEKRYGVTLSEISEFYTNKNFKSKFNTEWDSRYSSYYFKQTDEENKYIPKIIFNTATLSKRRFFNLLPETVFKLANVDPSRTEIDKIEEDFYLGDVKDLATCGCKKTFYCVLKINWSLEQRWEYGFEYHSVNSIAFKSNRFFDIGWNVEKNSNFKINFLFKGPKIVNLKFQHRIHHFKVSLKTKILVGRYDDYKTKEYHNSTESFLESKVPDGILSAVLENVNDY